MEKTITYDPNGSGENYGVQYHGTKVLQLIKAIKHLLIDKSFPMPLPSHHGLTIRLTRFGGFKVTILANNWTHKNKGNGNLNIRMYISDDSWVYTINRNGVCDHQQAVSMTDDVKAGFVKIVEKAGFSIGDEDVKGRGAYLNLNDTPEFVAHIMLNGDSEEVKNPRYQQSFDNFLGGLQEIFSHYELLK